MRILHTSDWHLGHALHQIEREEEHAAFLDWLVALARSQAIDALLITGDIFDNANPSAAAQSLWFDFLRNMVEEVPGIDIVVIAGNHDSPARLEAPASLLEPMGVRVVGRCRTDDGFDADSLVFPLHKDTEVAAWVAAVPFLRPSDLLPAREGAVDPLIDGVRQVYERVADVARSRLCPGDKLVVTGHLYASGTDLSVLSERRILGGNEHALPVDIFPQDADYVALGHLHKAQRVGGHEHIRYCGSPIPLSLAEAGYRHQVNIADLDSGEISVVLVPRLVEIMRVPKKGALPLEKVLAELAELPPLEEEATGQRPFLEVAVLLDEPQPTLRAEVEAALEGRWPRLVKLGVAYTGDGASLADAAGAELRDLDPLDVFTRRYKRDHEGDVPGPLLAAFSEVMSLAQDEEGA